MDDLEMFVKELSIGVYKLSTLNELWKEFGFENTLQYYFDNRKLYLSSKFRFRKSRGIRYIEVIDSEVTPLYVTLRNRKLALPRPTTAPYVIILGK